MWYVVWSEGRKERRLYDRISEDLDASLYGGLWLPIKKEYRKYHGKWREVERLLFPGYFMMDTWDPDRAHLALKGFEGYIGILRSAERYTPITETEEEILRKLSEPGRRPGISVGVIEDGRVRVLEGPLRGMEENIVSLDKHKRRVKLRMRLFDRSIEFSMGLVLAGDK